jgi:hypothetical protein
MFIRGYQHRSKLVKDKNGDMLADSHNILNKWKNYFSQLLNVHSFSDVRQLEIHMSTAEPLVPEVEVEIAIVKLKTYKLPGSVQILAELVQAVSETIRSEIHKLINSSWNKEELSDQWKESIIVPIDKGDKTGCSNYLRITLLSTSYKNYPIYFYQGSVPIQV